MRRSRHQPLHRGHLNHRPGVTLPESRCARLSGSNQKLAASSAAAIATSAFTTYKSFFDQRRARQPEVVLDLKQLPEDEVTCRLFCGHRD